jgi:hypothetical protein
MKGSVIACFVLAFAGIACSKKENVYSWQTEEEGRTLSLLKNGKFILSIRGGYYNRVDTGLYQMNGDTLILNPDKIDNSIDSVAVFDSLFNGKRFLEVYEETIEVDANNQITGSSYRPMIFPSAVINHSLSLSVSADDPSYHKLIIPDSVMVGNIKVNVREDNTCRPLVSFTKGLPAAMQEARSYRVYVPSRERRENYLAGFKWLMRSDTIESFFSSDSCESTEVKMVRR